MEKLQFDSGIRSFKVGAGVLRFNPTDPNVYARFLEVLDKLTALEQELTDESAAADAAGMLALLRRADARVKALLGEVFGPANDMEAIFGGINLLAVGDNGQRLLTNFLAALEPILHDGARRCAAAEARKA